MFSKENRQLSASYMKQVKYLALMAAFIAMKTVTGNIYIPISENLRIGISFVLVAVEAAIIGPVSGMVSGAVTDLVSFAMFPDGVFFPGYTLTAMLGEAVWGCFLYRRRITVWRLSIAKIINNYGINVLLGSLWSAMLYGKAYYYYFARSLIKNTLLLIPEILLLTAVFNLILPLLQQKHLVIDQGKLPVRLK